jgi:leucyl aminopeptidase
MIDDMKKNTVILNPYTACLLIQTLSFLVFLLFGKIVRAHGFEGQSNQAVLADLNSLKALGVPILESDESLNLGLAVLDPKAQEKLLDYNHARGKCGGFEALPTLNSDLSLSSSKPQLAQLTKSIKLQNFRNEQYLTRPFRAANLEFDPVIAEALTEIQPNNLRDTVDWLSKFPTRFNRAPNPNVPVEGLVVRLQRMTAFSKWPIAIERIKHKSTPQDSVRLRIIGTERPEEILVLGGHFDSIAKWSETAPGADDNASGSANLIESLRVLLTKNQPKRTIDFFWYAGEESGLLGSAEIAESYSRDGQNVIGVLQLDMTLHPGEGPMVIGNVEDYTSAWLRDYFKSMNDTYLNVKLVPDVCGYACSDHASWYRRGFPTLLPFEATTSTMNRLIHTPKDLINNNSNFDHSAVFSKVALIFAMDLGNSSIKQP